MRKSTAQKRKEHSLYVKRRKKAGKSILTVSVSVALLVIFFLTKSIVSQVVSAYSSNSSDLKDKDIYSILLIKKDHKDLIEKAELLVIQKADSKLYSIVIPLSLKVDLPGRLGEEEYGKILQISNSLEKEKEQASLLVDATKKVLKTDVDRYSISYGTSYDKLKEAAFSGELSFILPWNISNYRKNSDADVSTGELFELINFSRELNSRDRIELELSNIADLDIKLRDISLGGKVGEESLGIVILNGTDVPNVGKNVSEILQNMGARISLTTNAENNYAKSYVITDDPTSATVNYIKSYYPAMSILDKSSASSLGEVVLDRGDVCIIIGFDILEQLE